MTSHASPTSVQYQLAADVTVAGWQLASSHRSSPSVLALHGWLDNANSFLPLAHQLPELTWQSLDLAGHGHSSHRPAHSAYHFVDYVADLLQLCRQQQWQRQTLIGHSMGAMVASAFAAAFPEYVERLILIDAMGLMTTPSQDAAAQLRQGLLSRLQRDTKQMPSYPNLKAAAQARCKQSDFDEQTAMLLAQRGTAACGHGVTWRTDIRLREVSAIRYSPEQVHAILQQIQCPVLAVIATDGLSLTQQALKAYAQDVQHLKTVYLTGGHHLHMTNPVACADAIRLFLQQN